jgi:hypothetical protein
MTTALLWLFVVNVGVAFGAGLYEHRIVASRWLTTSPEFGTHWRADAARQDDTGRRFWAFVTTLPLTFLTLANLFAAWRSSGAVRGWWLAAGLAALADRAFTFGYFIPTMVWLMKAVDSPEAVAVATRWWNLNYLRHALVLAAWLMALEAFAILRQRAG